MSAFILLQRAVMAVAAAQMLSVYLEGFCVHPPIGNLIQIEIQILYFTAHEAQSLGLCIERGDAAVFHVGKVAHMERQGVTMDIAECSLHALDIGNYLLDRKSVV